MQRRLVILALACAMPAWGAPGETHSFHPFVGASWNYDDNLLRQPDGAEGSDHYATLDAGLLVDMDISRQNFYVLAKGSRVRFDRYRQLDYDGKDFTARWNWQFGESWSGRLEGAYNEVLAPFTDFHSNERNLRNEHRAIAEVMWRFVPDWRLRAAAIRDRFGYDLSIQRINDRIETQRELGLDYLAHSGNTAGIVLRKLHGDYPNHGSDDYDQDEIKGRVDWRPSGITKVTALAGWARRKHAFAGERDASGANGRASVDWAPQGAVTYTATVWREFSALESTVASYSLNRGASLAARLAASGKTRVDASYAVEKRAYASRVALPAGLDFSDTLRTASIGVTTQPTRSVQLGLSAYQQRRSGADVLGLGSFKAKGVTVSANLQF